MSLTQLLVVLAGRWRSAVMAACIALGLVLFATAAMWIYAPRYTASAALVLDVKSPDPIAGSTMPGATIPTYMATQVDVLYSERVSLRVIEALRLDRDPDLQADWQADPGGRGDYKSWLAERITRKLDARPGRESNVIGVKYTATDAKRSGVGAGCGCGRGAGAGVAIAIGAGVGAGRVGAAAVFFGAGASS